MEMPKPSAEDVAQELMKRAIKREADNVEAAQHRGPRPKRTASDFVRIPRPPVIMRNVLAAEMNTLGGPSEAGKSLLARDWTISIAAGLPWRGHPVTEWRNVLWIASEGLHDFEERFADRPGWDVAHTRIYVLDEAVNLLQSDDVDWLIKEYAAERPGLVVFDVIYGMGMTDDTGTKDVFPVIGSMKKISAAFGGATLALGHNGHDGSRRFRGSSAWRQLTYTEWHLADGRLTCEKSKIADKRRLAQAYRAEYPELVWLSEMEHVADAAERDRMIREDIDRHPGDSNLARARRLAPLMRLSESSVRGQVAAVKRAMDGG